MSTTPIGGYRYFQKLHPLSLLAQLTSRRVTGCLHVFTSKASWSIYLEDGKLIYASCSDNLFERLENHLLALSKEAPGLHSATRMQVRLIFEAKGENQSAPDTDYQAICWLVNQSYITAEQAASLIEELAKDVLETFLTLKEGGYEFSAETSLDELPKFCYLDLRSLIEYCQRKIRDQQNPNASSSSSKSVQSTPVVSSSSKQPLSAKEVKPNLATQNNKITSNSGLPPNQPKAPGGNSKNMYTVACIDDSPTVLNSIRRFLDENTFSVVMISDPVKALMQILRSKPDLILLDVEMPNLDGYELCSLLRRHSAFKNIPIIMVTGRTGFIDRAKAKMVRSSGYLAKPFTQSELLKIVFKHIS